MLTIGFTAALQSNLVKWKLRVFVRWFAVFQEFMQMTCFASSVVFLFYRLVLAIFIILYRIELLFYHI